MIQLKGEENMVAVIAGKDAKSVTITGHGIKFPGRHELEPGVFIDPSVVALNVELVADGCRSLHEYAAVLTMESMATFSLVIERELGGPELATKAWNALWQFHLLSLACGAPCFPLYTVSGETKPTYGIANRNLVINPLSELHEATAVQVGVERTCIAYRARTIQGEWIRSPRCAGWALGCATGVPGEGRERIVTPDWLRGGSSRPRRQPESPAAALAGFRKRTIGRQCRCPAEKKWRG